MVKTLLGKISTADFAPAIGCQNPHFQTIVPKFFVKAPHCKFVNERVITPDGDFLDLAWHMPVSPKAVVVLFHGLEGSSNSHYIQHLAAACGKVEIACVLMHFRGCSGEPNKKPISYHSGATFDAEFIIPMVKQRYPQLPLFAVGFSLGGNMLMKLMASNKDIPVQASVAVSAPLNLAASSTAINHGFSSVYQWHLMKSMKRNVINKMAFVDMSNLLHQNAGDIEKMRTFREFDDHITSILHGYKDANDYYTKCSALKDLVDIAKPTLIIHAADDPFMDERVIPNAHEISDMVAYELSEFGGHVGFLSRLYGEEKLWLPQRIIAFIEECLHEET